MAWGQAAAPASKPAIPLLKGENNTLDIKSLHRYDQDVDTVFKNLTDPDFVKTKYEGIGARNVEIVKAAEDSGGRSMETKRELPANVPGLLSKFLGAWNRIEQTETWQGGAGAQRQAKMSINIVSLPLGLSVPVTVTGTQTLSADGGGCTNEVQMSVNCGIPLVGGKLADFVGGDIKRFMDEEYEFTRNYLGK